MLKILIQGELGSFHHQAATRLFGESIAIIPCATFAEVFAKLTDKDIALVAHENSLYGNINEVYDLLEKLAQQNPAPIFAETELAVHQNLIGVKNAKKSDLKEIYSHPVALAQCENYLNEKFPSAEKIEFEDTAAAVRYITELSDPTKAALAGAAAAQLYGAKILAENIEDNPVNFTKFIALSIQQNHPQTAVNSKISLVKSSIILTTSHQPGALFAALKIFNDEKINLTKLHSRPIIGQKFRYKFYLDFIAETKTTQDIITKLHKAGNHVILLGNYPVL